MQLQQAVGLFDPREQNTPWPEPIDDARVPYVAPVVGPDMQPSAFIPARALRNSASRVVVPYATPLSGMGLGNLSGIIPGTGLGTMAVGLGLSALSAAAAVYGAKKNGGSYGWGIAWGVGTGLLTGAAFTGILALAAAKAVSKAASQASAPVVPPSGVVIPQR